MPLLPKGRRKLPRFFVNRVRIGPGRPEPYIRRRSSHFNQQHRNVATLCDILGVPLVLDQPRDLYMHGWGQECLNAQMINCYWTLTLHCIHGLPTSFAFDLVQGSSPLLLGLDIKEFSNTCNLSNPRYIKFKRPTDTKPRRLFTYITTDTRDHSLRIEIVSHRKYTIRSLMENVRHRPELPIAKKDASLYPRNN